jgi:hypothetical protein
MLVAGAWASGRSAVIPHERADKPPPQPAIVRRRGYEPRRVAKLYLPSAGKYFGSREGYGLTYTSCQESGKSRGLYRLLAAEMGTDEKTISRRLDRLMRPRCAQ